jgi:hypothetical protein
MAYSYQNFTGTGSQATFTFANIDGFLDVGDLYVYVDSVLKTSGTHYNINGSAKTVTFTAGNIPVAGANIKVLRVTPKGVADRPVDFTDGSVLTAYDLDTSALQLLYIAQEAADGGSEAMGPTQTGTAWDAGSKRLTNVSNPLESQDAVTKVYVDQLALYGGVSSNPQSWTLTAVNNQQQYTLPSPAPLNLNKEFFIVMVGGVVQPTDNYSFTVSGSNYYLNFPAAVAAAIDVPGTGTVKIIIRNFGTTRVANTGSVGTSALSDEAVTSAKIAAGAVNTAALGASSVTAEKISANAIETAKIADDAVTAAKIAADAVGSSEIVDGAVTASKLAAGSVVSSLGYTPIGTTGTYSSLSGNYTVTSGTLTVPNPTEGGHATNKTYVDTVATPLTPSYLDYGTLVGSGTVTRTVTVANLSLGRVYVYRAKSAGAASTHNVNFVLGSGESIIASSFGPVPVGGVTPWINSNIYLSSGTFIVLNATGGQEMVVHVVRVR